MKSIVKVLICPSDVQGVGHFRSIWPAQNLKRYHSDGVDVRIDVSPNTGDVEYLSQFDIIHFHRAFGPYENSESLFGELRRRGVKLIMDIDDYWMPPPTHNLHPLIIADKLNLKIENNLRLVDVVSTTTEIFAEEIRKFNKNVVIIPNGLDMSHQMWKSQVQPNPSNKLRISWIGGSSHYHDLIKIKDSMELLANDNTLKDRFQFIMCGFDVRGQVTEMNGDERRVRSIERHETIWLDFERFFTSNYQLIKDDPEYKKWLLKIENKNYPDLYAKNYVRRWTLPLTQYAKHYDYCDVCIAPLAETYESKSDKGQISYKLNSFNFFKSELKLIESGMKHKALIAQDFGVYADLIEHGKTGLLVNKSDDKKGWYKAIKTLVNNPELREELAHNLHEFVKDRYDINTVNKQRVEFYRALVAEKETAPV